MLAAGVRLADCAVWSTGGEKLTSPKATTRIASSVETDRDVK
ncbi:hypothetical protein A4R44_00154 [Amycolatopsis sp. M39]|uniref:Uncharacterized protein n=1 Tax=Amycolatopsis rubida TaxID=112413 RepID=A0A1I5WCP2_9PSEU|nr:hypothetical protein A4R44_00154 [Amycolatopsis sp. M39]SFQ17490.1 hypothetical protein SAMN05421854_109164 [Amycolatopsis rubida]